MQLQKKNNSNLQNYELRFYNEKIEILLYDLGNNNLKNIKTAKYFYNLSAIIPNCLR